jgi:glutamate synthase domain-containing protein 3
MAALARAATEPVITGEVARVDCRDKSTREINQAIRRLVDQGHTDVEILHPAARHNLAVAVFGQTRLTFAGSVGYFCAGMIDGPEVHVRGNCGWSVGEDMMAGLIRVDGNAGNSAGAAIRGGRLFVRGNAGARAGISMKGGLIVVGGSVGYMTGFMMQKGTIVVCGDAGEALGDSMYDGRIFVAGRIAALGNDAVEAPVTAEDEAFLAATMSELGTAPPGSSGSPGQRFRKIECGRRLWNFSKKEMGLWKEAL